MSLLTPERVPVKVYKWDDTDAPQLDKSAGCMMTIFKGCLVTGYGTKESAGWTMPFEDTTAKVKVFRPELGAETDFYLRCSGDNGTQMTAQVYLNMTAQNKGTLKLQGSTPFKYAKGVSSGKWLMVASPRGFWFFCEQGYEQTNLEKKGAYFFCGDTTSSNVDRAVYLQHSGGSWDDGDFANILGWRYADEQGVDTSYIEGKLLTSDKTVITTRLKSIANGVNNDTNDESVTTPILIEKQKLYMLPGLYIPFNGTVRSNFDTLSVGTSTAINFGMSGSGVSNSYIVTDHWWY